MAGFIQGVQSFFGTPFGAGVASIACLWMLIDIIKKIK